jgi:hypothetical protein
VATRFLVGGLDPLAVAVLRYGIAALCLVAIAGPAAACAGTGRTCRGCWGWVL